MRVRLHHWWEVASSGYWFVPSVMMIFAGIGAFLMLIIDRRFIGPDVEISWLYSGGSSGASTLLSTVAGSVITVAGVVFSITIAALTQASGQFGPRLLRNFMRDKGNQIVLGTFVATFLYCLIILRTIHGKFDQGAAFVPQASVTVAVLLAIASIAVLIYFIHHVSISLQAPSVVATVREDLVNVMKSMAAHREKLADNKEHPFQPTKIVADALPDDFDDRACAVTSTCDGYIEAIDYDQLLHFAEQKDLILRLDCRPGDYIIRKNALLHAWPADRCSEDLSIKLNECFICGDHATAEQDVEYAVRQLVEIAVRALSPGINDPFTAINCIDALGSAVCLVSRIGLPGPLRKGADDQLRLVMPVSTFEGITDVAFNQIRQYGRDSVAVTIRLLEVIAACAPQAANAEQRKALLRHAAMVYRQSQKSDNIPEKYDREDVKNRWKWAAKALGADPVEHGLLGD